MPRDNRYLLVLLIGGGFLLALFAASNPFAPTRPTELLPAGDAPPDAEVTVTYDLAALSPGEAARLDGKRALYRVTIDGPPSRMDGRDLYEVLPPRRPAGDGVPAGRAGR